MKARFAVLALAGLLLGGCYYAPYGEPNVAGAALLGAGVGAAAGAAIASGPTYYAPAPYYAPRPYYGYGYYPHYGYRRW
ncbi:hypothetical protein D9599_06240 [Roseomonas sp. KE2513]|uniref:hypothetical protein n=1 Tax=Roseomonadaceae TaxID=3385906 RepID=UPI0006939F03|nr:MULTISPECIES: hypothetical protein [Roseomonas]MBI0535167.1 hypothetical protein [Roseomonas sp. KE2513]